MYACIPTPGLIRIGYQCANFTAVAVGIKDRQSILDVYYTLLLYFFLKPDTVLKKCFDYWYLLNGISSIFKTTQQRLYDVFRFKALTVFLVKGPKFIFKENVRS